MIKQVSFGAAALIAATAGNAEPLEKQVVGPKLICLKYSTFSLQEGERVTDLSGSPEGILIKVEGASGNFEIGESEIFAPARGAKKIVASRERTSIYRVAGHGGRYAIYGPTSFSNGGDRLVVWLSGSALRGNSGDASVYSRFRVRDTSRLNCGHTFTYSFEF